MEPGDVAQLAILFILLLLSAFFSSAETSFTSLNKIRIKSMVDEGSKKASLVFSLLEKQDKFLSTILIGNNLVNIGASSLTTTMVIDWFGNAAVGIATGILTLLVLLFGEITPKTLASIKAEKMAFVYAPFINLLMIIFTPLTFIVSKLSKGIMFILRIDPSKAKTQMTENELLTIVDVSVEDGVIESEEQEMITNVVDFGDTLAKDVMVPSINMECVPTDIGYTELIDRFTETQYSRMPVYKDSKDNIVGIIWAKDLLVKYKSSSDSFDITKYMREPFFTYEFKKTNELMSELKAKYKSIAIVLDEYGATAGLITIEDLIEEIVGEIRDETDLDEVDSVKSLSDNVFECTGIASLEDINKECGLSIDSEDYDSIAGHVIHLMNHLPKVNETVMDGTTKYTVLATGRNRITKIRIETNLPEQAESNKED